MNRKPLPRLIACCAALCLASAASADPPAAEVEWRQEYVAALKEARTKNRCLVIDVSTENCFYCKQLDARTFREPSIVRLLNERCVPLKVDAGREPVLAGKLGVQSYPTLIFATADGKVLGSQVGFIEAAGLEDLLQRAFAAAAAPPEWMVRDWQEASQAVESADFARALILLRKIIEDGKDRPVQADARKALQRLEEKAADHHARARELADKGKHADAVETVSELLRLYPGTKAAAESTKLLVTLVSRTSTVPSPVPSPSPAPPPPDKGGCGTAKDLLVQARDDFGRKHFLACLDRCEVIAAHFADTPEAAEAGHLAAEIRGNPDMTRQAAEQMSERLGVLYLQMAESSLRKGQPQQAVFYLERVVQSFPNSRHAELAQVRLAQIQGAPLRITERDRDRPERK